MAFSIDVLDMYEYEEMKKKRKKASNLTLSFFQKLTF